jgi:hypothetical protein
MTSALLDLLFPASKGSAAMARHDAFISSGYFVAAIVARL